MHAELRPTMTPEDHAFVEAFHAGQIANQNFHHRDHLRLAWVQIHRLGLDNASEAVTAAIRGFAAHHGSADRYNDTLTRFWLRVMAAGIGRHPEMTFDQLLAAEPHLLDKTLPFRHWSRERLTGPEAKRAWVDPDLAQLPVAS
jgi:hypothetical protein